MQFERWIYTFPLRLRSLFRRSAVDRELDEELQYHLERTTEQNLAKGLLPDDARRAAMRAMDGLTQRKEECRDTWRLNLIDNTVRDVRYALRVLAQSPGVTAVAVVTLALAIGANAVAFGLVDALILRPLNVPGAATLYGVEHGNEHTMHLSYPDYLDLRDRNRSFKDLAAFNIATAGLDAGGDASRVWVVEASGNYFDALGIQPHLGRMFHGSDERGPDSAPYAVLSYAFWQSHFQSDPGVVGRSIRLNKHPFTVIGVAPRHFQGTLLFFMPDLFVPLVNQAMIEGRYTLDQRSNPSIFMGAMGHLKPGKTPEQAIADLNSIGAILEKTYPKDHGQTTFRLARPALYGNHLGQPVRGFLTGLTLLAGLILLAACANLANLFAARGADRSREVALRLALGASRERVLRQLLTEAALIACAGGVLGLVLSIAALRGLSAWQPLPALPVSMPLNPDAGVYLMALLLAVVSAMLFGIVPARQISRTDAYQTIKAGPGFAVMPRLALRDLLLVGQIVICAVLVTASFVAVRGLTRSLNTDLGFEPREAMLVETDLAMGGYSGDRAGEMQERIIGALAAIPGVTWAASVGRPPLSEDGYISMIFTAETGDLRPSNALVTAKAFHISPDYFAAAGTTLISGRSFNWHDRRGAPHVAVVNQEFARRVFGPGTNPIGRSYKIRNGTRIQIVGLVEDGKYASLAEDRRPAVFRPVLQAPLTEMWLVVRSKRDPRELAAAIQTRLRALDPALPFSIQTWSQKLGSAFFPSRVSAAALGILGAIGAMLSVSGIFAMAAYSVSKRMKELGIRMALGARGRDVLLAALGRAFGLLAAGSVAGIILGTSSGRLLASVVYQAAPGDPVVAVAAVATMLIIGLAATWIPARRALSVNPVRLLREE